MTLAKGIRGRILLVQEVETLMINSDTIDVFYIRFSRHSQTKLMENFTPAD